MSQKIVKLAYWLVPVLLLCLCPSALLAQEKEAQEKQESKAEKKATHNPKTITGCLQKGDQPDEFTITGDDGKTWGLRSSGKVNLSEHIGHKVTITGSPMRESKAEEKKAEEKKGEKK